MKWIESSQFQWIEDKDLSLLQRQTIEYINSIFFPENLVDGIYPFDDKQLSPHRLLLQHDHSIVAHLLTVIRTIVVQQQTMQAHYVGELCVHPRYQGRGLGRELLSIYSQTMSQSSADFSILICESENLGFYEKCGWTQAKQLTVTLGPSNELSKVAEGIIFVLQHTQHSQLILDAKTSIFLGEPV